MYICVVLLISLVPKTRYTGTFSCVSAPLRVKGYSHVVKDDFF